MAIRDLRTLEGLESLLAENPTRGEYRNAGTIFCPSCAATRIVDAHRYLVTNARSFGGQIAVFELSCAQCAGSTTAVLYPGPGGPALVLLHDSRGGATPNTPAGVAYYLDQAKRSETMGARSAAVAMYRAALEHLLYQHGFTTGMLAQKIKDLEGTRGTVKAPPWLNDLDGAFLTVIKDLGNASIHPNGGDVSVQAALSEKLLALLGATFAALLDLVYERAAKQRALLAEMQAAKASLSSTPP